MQARQLAQRAPGIAAELFVSHIGSWVAAGWAHVIAGDRAAGRARFERALALDDRFAETQGALAVLDVVEGQLGCAEMDRLTPEQWKVVDAIHAERTAQRKRREVKTQ